MKRIPLLFGMAMSVILCFAQQSIVFQHTFGYGDYNHGMDILPTADSGFIALANVSVAQSTNHIQLFKLNKYGMPVWYQKYEDPALFWAEKMTATLDGGYLITGYSNKKPDMGYSLFLLKTDANGNKEWLRHYGGSDWDFGKGVTIDSLGNFYATGQTYSYATGESDVYVLKFDAQGDTLWTRTYGGNGKDGGQNIIVCRNGDIVVAGFTTNQTTGNYDGLLLRYDSGGTLVWSNTYGGAENDKFFDVKELPDSSLSFLGYAESFGNGTPYYYFGNLTSSGILNWERTDGWSGGHHGVDKGYAMDLTSDGGYVLIGTTTALVCQNIFLMKMHSTGSWHFSPVYGYTGTDDARAVIQTYDNGFAFIGSSEYYGDNLANIYIVKTDPDGNSGPYNNVPIKDKKTLVKIYPNPFDSFATVELQEACHYGCRFTVYNPLGQIVTHKTISPDEKTFYLSGDKYRAGIYHYRLDGHNGLIDSGAFVKYE